MKNLFALDLTEDKDNGRLDGAIFETARVDQDAALRMDALFKEGERLAQRAHGPGWVSSLFYFCLLAAAVVAFFFVSTLFSGEGGDPIGRGTLLVIALLLGTVAVFLHRYAARRRAELFEGEESTDLERRMKEEERCIQASLGVPPGTAETDVLSFRYKTDKKGETQIVVTGFWKHINLVYNVWREGDLLHFANWDHRITLPVSALGQAERVPFKTLLPRWTKSTPPTEGEYAPYGLETNRYGVRIGAAYRVRVTAAEGEFEFLVPEYEKERLAALGIPVAEGPQETNQPKGENQ